MFPNCRLWRLHLHDNTIVKMVHNCMSVLTKFYGYILLLIIRKFYFFLHVHKKWTSMNEMLSESIKQLYSFLTVSIGLAFIVRTFGKWLLLFLAIKYDILHVAHCLLTVFHVSSKSPLALSLLCFLKQPLSPFHVSHTDIHKHFHVQV